MTEVILEMQWTGKGGHSVIVVPFYWHLGFDYNRTYFTKAHAIYDFAANGWYLADTYLEKGKLLYRFKKSEFTPNFPE